MSGKLKISDVTRYSTTHAYMESKYHYQSQTIIKLNTVSVNIITT